MKTRNTKGTTHLQIEFPGMLAALFTTLLTFNLLPSALSADLFWTGTAANPTQAGSGPWVTTISTGTPFSWSTTATLPTNAFWTDGSTANFVGAPGGTATLGTNITAAGINFGSGANTFTIDTSVFKLTIDGTGVPGAGIVNSSGKTQTITNTNSIRGGISAPGTGGTVFLNASAGNATIVNSGGGTTEFEGTSTAGSATISTGSLSVLTFSGTSTAGNAAITNDGESTTNFINTSSAGNATITNNIVGFVHFHDSSTAANATITNNALTVGSVVFFDTSTAGNATIITNVASTDFIDGSDGGTARAITNANAFFDISGLTSTGMNIGSIEGAGTYFLGSKTLTAGGNNLNTTVSGIIQDGGRSGGAGGSLTKTGTGTLTLAGANTYTGGTTISTGTLQLGNGGTSGSIIGNVDDNGILAFDRSDAPTFAGVISGLGGVTQIGLGTTILTGTNTYTGGTTISAGTLRLGNGGAAGSIIGDVMDIGILAFDRSDASTFAGLISGLGSVTQIGTGTTILTGTNSYTGGTTISAGTLQLGNGGTTGSITGNVSNNGILAFDRSDASTFAGVISGLGSLAQIGSGTTILTASNTYTGGTTISAGTLQLGDGGSSGSITGNVTDNGTLAFNRSDSVNFPGVISGTGNVVKMGTGTLTLPATNTYTGTTTVDSGSLIVDGSIASAQTVVNPGGFLGGHGTIGGNLINNGIVSQINSPGTLTVAGNYTQSAGGTLRIGVAGVAPAQHDLLAVNGHATLGGALQLIQLGNFTFQPGDQITVVTAKNGVSGTFSNVQNGFVSTGTIVQAEVTTLPEAVVLEAIQGSFLNTPGVVNSPNTRNVASALDSARGDPRAAALFAFLDSQPLANLTHDLELIAPTQITSINATAVSVSKVQVSNVGQRLANIRGGSTGFSSAGFSISGGAASIGDGFAGVIGPEGKSGPAVFAPTPDNRWGVFVTGIGEFNNVDSTPNAAGYDVNTGGVTFGVDYRLTPYCAIGLTGGYAHTSVGLDGGGNIDVNGGKIGAYATLFGNGFYLDTAVSGGPSGYNTHRTALQGTASGSTDGADFDTLVALGYDWKRGNLSIGPTASFQYSYIGLNAFTETGSLAPLKFPDQNTESERTAFGGKASYDWKIGQVTVIPQVSAAWQHEFGATAYSVVANFASGAGNSFSVSGPEIGRDSILVGAGATVIWNERVSTYLYYDGEFARTNYLSNNVSAGVRVTF